jgi:2-oxoglutarate ferredoxin oxidoreductase subunit alpha
MVSGKVQKTSKSDSFSVLIGGKAGYGIDKSSTLLAQLFNTMGYYVYVYRDYPSLIRGGHTFSIIRASNNPISTHINKVDYLLALNQDSWDLHKDKLKKNTTVIFDADEAKAEGIAIPVGKFLKEANASDVMRNTCVIGAFCKAAGIEWAVVEKVFKKNMPKELDLNLAVAKKGFDSIPSSGNIKKTGRGPLPILTGNEAISLGLIKGGLKAYLAYPMTPTSTILHFLAENADRFGLKVMHPESEIGVVIMALGFAYSGVKTAVGTSGGGFCLMTEGVSFAGMAEHPMVFVIGQRPGPSTGLPTYTSQTELHFVLNAGQGEFPRFVVAPGDAQEAYFWSAVAMNTAWKYQVQSFIMTDKTLSEGGFDFDIDAIDDVKEEQPLMWDGKGTYKRYLDTKNGVSPLAFVPNGDAVIKTNSYEHDEAGLTIEDPAMTKIQRDKLIRKGDTLSKGVEGFDSVNVLGNKKSSKAILCWGSNKGVCAELGEKLGLRVVQPVVLWPFPAKQFAKAVKGVKKLICVENNSTGQLAKLVKMHGFDVDGLVLKYDGRPFSLDELESKILKVMK